MNPSDPKHDYETPIEVTSSRLAKFIIEKINENKDDLLLVPKQLKPPIEPVAPIEPEGLEAEVPAAMENYEEAMSKYNTDKAEYDILNIQYDADVTEARRVQESMIDFSISIMKEITSSDIPFPYASKGIEKVQKIVDILKQYVNGSITQARHEYASRSLGVRSPSNGKFTEECATVGELMLKLNDVRVAQGNNPKDYFMD